MARLYPTLPPRAAMTAGDHAEIDLLATLERGLSDAYTLFHSVDWSRGAGRLEQHGEIDIVVVNQRGDVLLMEVKSGDVDFLPGGIFKTYGGKPKDITAQIGLQFVRTAARGREALPAPTGQHQQYRQLPRLLCRGRGVRYPPKRNYRNVGIQDHVHPYTTPRAAARTA